MFCTVLSSAVVGVEGVPVHVEADVTEGLPAFAMVGFLTTQVREAQERVRSALKHAEVSIAPKRVTVNLSPADLRKSGTGFDLPIAAAIAGAYQKVPAESLEGIMMAGELSLNGEVLPVPGILPMVEGACKCGCRCCVIPKGNVLEALAVRDMDIIGVETLKELMDFLKGEKALSPAVRREDSPKAPENWEDFSDIAGQEAAKRAIEVAVAGFHNLLMMGEPGAGKSMLARRIPTILPEMSYEEQFELSKIYSICGLLNAESPLLLKRPFRAPHHTITASAMAGGGRIPKPGEVSLAHHGALFLDELPEFSREALEALRQPLEDGEVLISRSGGVCCFPANVMLVAAMNPCPCGYYPNLKKCSCTHTMVRRYLSKVSGPFLDRMDLTIEVPAVSYQDLTQKRTAETSRQIRERVKRARRLQEERFAGTAFRFNGDLDQRGIRKYCCLKKEEQELMGEAFARLELTARSYFRILKVARTAADLEESEEIQKRHLLEALGYRSISRKEWTGQ